MRPRGPFSDGSSEQGTEACVVMIADHVDIHLAAEFIGREFEHRTGDRDAGIVDEAIKRFA